MLSTARLHDQSRPGKFVGPGSFARVATLAALSALAAGLWSVSLVAQEQEGPLRGGRFEFGVLTGPGSFQAKSGIASCRWQGLRIGHRFAPFPGNEKLRVGFRTGWEGCLTNHETEGRVDLIHVNAGLYFGIQTGRRWLLYWFAGVGELLGDSTPGPRDDVEPRFAVHGGPGATWAFSDRFFLDVSIMGTLFEGYELSGPDGTGTTWGLIPNLMLGIQI